MHMIYPSRLSVARKFLVLLTYGATILLGCNKTHMTGMTSDEWSLPSQSHQDVFQDGATILDSVHSELSNPPAVPEEVLVAEDVSLFPSEVASAARRTIGIGSVGQSTHQLTTPMTPPTESVRNESSARLEESMLRPGVSGPVSPLPPTLHRSKRYLSCGQAGILGAGAFSLGSYMTHMLFNKKDTVGLEEISLLYNSCLATLESPQNVPHAALLWGYPAERVAMGGIMLGGVLVGVPMYIWKNKMLKKMTKEKNIAVKELKEQEKSRYILEGRLDAHTQSQASTKRGDNTTLRSK